MGWLAAYKADGCKFQLAHDKQFIAEQKSLVLGPSFTWTESEHPFACDIAFPFALIELSDRSSHGTSFSSRAQPELLATWKK